MSVACAKPVPLERLHDYFSAELEPSAAEAVEAHVFSCDGCCAAFERAGALRAALSGLIPPVISHEKLEQLRRAGEQIRLTNVEAGVPARAEFSQGLSLMVHALRGDLRGAERIDFDVCDQDGRTLVELSGVPVDLASGEVLVACQRHYQHEFPEAALFRLWAVRGEQREPIGEYVVEHIW